MLTGVDGARNGWVYCILEDARVTFELLPRFYVYEGTMWVDIPIGLPSCGERACDRLARKMLSSRSSTVFTVPMRSAVYAETYAEALEINRRLTGKGFSKQFWNIRNKVIEVDSLLRVDKSLRWRIFESHPELCFLTLAGRQLKSKHVTEGVQTRLELLESLWRGAKGIVEEARNKLKVEIHDLLDAFVLAVSQTLPSGSFPEEPEYDEHGIPMRIVYPLATKGGLTPLVSTKSKEG